jgi:tripartite-type tricarboxylate transporter receptor subunit TctC
MQAYLLLIRRLVVAIVAGFAVVTFNAHGYPDKPIRMIVPQPAGGAMDIFGRMIAEKLGPALGQTILVDNRGGAGGVIATEAVAKATPDGYTLLLGAGSTHGTNSIVYKKLPYDPIRDFAPVSLLVRPQFALFVYPGFPARTVGELVAVARTQPGKINYASYGLGTPNHLMTEELKAMTGIDLVHIPYKGSVAAQLGVIANDAQLLIDGITNAAAHVQSGKLRMIGVASMSRSPLAPGTPTISESGVPGFTAGGYYGVFAPAGTAREAIAVLHRELVRAQKQPDLHERLLNRGYEVVGGSPEELADEVVREIAKWQRVVRERNLKFE